MEDRGRENYSSYSSFSSPHMKPAPVGSRGRGTPAYPESTFGSRNYDAFGGPSTGRGRGRGHMSDFGSIHRPGIVVDYQNKPTNVTVTAARGIKRKMMQPFNKPGGTFIKKPKLAKPVEKMSLSKSPTKTDPKNEEEEKRRIEARREKQRRRREKNSEKYGDGYRMAFTCSFCKFRTFEEKDIELHLESSSHQETLDHIQKQTKFDKVVMEFLHECMVNKFKKTSIRKQQTNNQTEVVKIIEKDVMEGVTADDHMMKVETVHCSACSVYIPALHSSVQQHLKSPDHIKGKQAYKEQIKRESVLTATSILNNPIVKARYERFIKVTMYENVLESNTNDSNRINNGSYIFGNVLMYAKHCARYLRGFYHSKEGALFNIPILQMGKIKLRRVKAEEKLKCPDPARDRQTSARRPFAAGGPGDRAHNFGIPSLDDDMLLGSNASEEIENNNENNKAK
ncbi:DBIRD complex subunit ZNF326 [Globicephala melas]|uniref:DBIRD complex subunit ZNF326 n=1 Tax=Globicephala melas TaxID=9731 RepID=UPI00293D996D|nr:DBIRD complex subunit ZNF326 [Globicephala melas]